MPQLKSIGWPPPVSVIDGLKVTILNIALKTMSSYGLVEMVKENRHVRLIAKATEFEILAV
ncbi:MAG: hypothetical protein Q8L68_05475 [Methylococcales bacterium]|nr:hypothetical protein [Methylococcales bacterium]